MAQQLGCVAVVCDHHRWTAQAVASVQAIGLRALTYTVNEAPDVQRMLAWGVDGIITDAVDRFPPAA